MTLSSRLTKTLQASQETTPTSHLQLACLQDTFSLLNHAERSRRRVRRRPSPRRHPPRIRLCRPLSLGLPRLRIHRRLPALAIPRKRASAGSIFLVCAGEFGRGKIQGRRVVWRACGVGVWRWHWWGVYAAALLMWCGTAVSSWSMWWMGGWHLCRRFWEDGEGGNSRPRLLDVLRHVEISCKTWCSRKASEPHMGTTGERLGDPDRH